MSWFGKKQSQPLESWISPKAQKGLASPIHGKGLFAVQAITKGETIALKAGHPVDKTTLDQLPKANQTSALQISDDFYLAALTDDEHRDSMVYINHSCGPNVGMGGSILFRAIRDISAGEELTIDYAMIYSSPEFSMTCNCKYIAHRPIVSGNDWKDPGLRQKYAGYFSWYIQQKINTP
jgi:uncharacterized protein